MGSSPGVSLIRVASLGSIGPGIDDYNRSRASARGSGRPSAFGKSPAAGLAVAVQLLHDGDGALWRPDAGPSGPRRELRGLVNWEDTIIDAAATDTGMRRTNNQDSFRVVRSSNAESWRNRGHMFIVADGMGAHAVG